eukprot:TRINITY_DN143_c0_g1_i1.p1 TRINITY_DN143_c0_g1~~TRINITY_DN143_c0_g1_i1.p1  ORF type:complete len:273 (+),score=24.82 TRINITY_DN143_c0_g1_i1:62-820(+)
MASEVMTNGALYASLAFVFIGVVLCGVGLFMDEWAVGGNASEWSRRNYGIDSHVMGLFTIKARLCQASDCTTKSLTATTLSCSSSGKYFGEQFDCTAYRRGSISTIVFIFLAYGSYIISFGLGLLRPEIYRAACIISFIFYVIGIMVYTLVCYLVFVNYYAFMIGTSEIGNSLVLLLAAFFCFLLNIVLSCYIESHGDGSYDVEMGTRSVTRTRSIVRSSAQTGIPFAVALAISTGGNIGSVGMGISSGAPF